MSPYSAPRQIALFLFSLSTSGVMAQTVPAPSDIPQWGIGIGVRAERKPYRDFGTDTKAIPLISYNSDRFRVFGTAADWKLYNDRNVELSLRARYLDDGYKSSDAAVLEGMDKRKGGVSVGAAGIWSIPFAKMSLEWLSDASGDSDGQTFRLGIERGFKITPSSTITPHARLTWMNDDYVNYYYGVKESEAHASRQAYSPGATTNASLGVRFDYSLNTRHFLTMDVEMTRYGSQIKESPLVDRSSSPAVRFGYIYRF